MVVADIDVEVGKLPAWPEIPELSPQAIGRPDRIIVGHHVYSVGCARRRSSYIIYDNPKKFFSNDCNFFILQDIHTRTGRGARSSQNRLLIKCLLREHWRQHKVASSWRLLAILNKLSSPFVLRNTSKVAKVANLLSRSIGSAKCFFLFFAEKVPSRLIIFVLPAPVSTICCHPVSRS